MVEQESSSGAAREQFGEEPSMTSAVDALAHATFDTPGPGPRKARDGMPRPVSVAEIASFTPSTSEYRNDLELRVDSALVDRVDKKVFHEPPTKGPLGIPRSTSHMLSFLQCPSKESLINMRNFDSLKRDVSIEMMWLAATRDVSTELLNMACTLEAASQVARTTS